MTALSALDILAIAFYFLALLAIGYWAARREKVAAADYFLASREVGWLAVAASLFASNIGSEHLVGLAGTGAASGLAVGHFEWLACLILLLLGWVFVPFYLRSGVYTMPEFLERRYNAAARWYLATVSIIGYVLTKISVTLFAGAIVIRGRAKGLVVNTGSSTMVGQLALEAPVAPRRVLGGQAPHDELGLRRDAPALHDAVLLVPLAPDEFAMPSNGWHRG